MKKIFVVFLVLIISLALTAGCATEGEKTKEESTVEEEETTESSSESDDAEESSSESADVEDVNLIMWHSFTQGGRKDFMDQAAADFEAQNPGVTITMEVFPWADFYTKWTTGLTSGQVPDISTALPTHVSEMIEVGAVIPLNDAIDEIGRDRFYADALSQYTINDENFGIPIYAHAHVLWYRKDLLSAAGLSVPETWSDLLAAATAINNPPEYYGLSMPMGINDYVATKFLNLYVRSAGGFLLSEEGTVDLTNDIALDGIKYWVDVYNAASPEDSINYATLEQSTLFYKGQAAFDFNSGFHVTGVQSNSPDLLDSISCAPVLKVDINDPVYGNIADNIPVVVWEKCEHPDIAKKFIEFMLEKERYVQFLHSVPVGMLAVLKDVADSAEFLEEPLIEQFSEEVAIIQEAVSIGSGIGMEFGPRVEASILTNQGIIEEMFQSIVINGTPIEEAAQAAEDELNSLIGN